MTGGTSGPGGGQFTDGGAETRPLQMFISYRRGDAAAHAGRLNDLLVARFGRDTVFMDVDTIEPGADYAEVIGRAVGHCDVLIALIGPHWLDAATARGRRLDDPQDLVRLEIESALARDIRVIPTLVGGARMPDLDELPGSLSGLARRNAVELTDSRFRSDIQFLLDPLDRIAQQKGRVAVPPGHQPGPEFVAGAAASVAALQPGPQATPGRGSARPESAGQPRPKLTLPKMPLVVGIVAAVLLVGGASALAVSWLHANKAANSSAQSKAANLLALPSRYIGTWTGSGHSFSPSVDFAITMTIRAGQVGQVVGEIDRPTLGCKQELILDKATTQSVTLTEQGGFCSVSAGQVAGNGYKILASLSGSSLGWKEFASDPSAINPTASASATLAQGSSGAIPGTSNLIAIPDADIGTWKGSGHAFSPSVDFAITMTLRAGQVGQVVGEIDRPTLGCKQDLILDKATTQSITLTEQGGFCSVSAGQVAGNGYKILASLSGASLDWKEFAGDPSASSATASASATLAQGSSGAIPGTSNLIAIPDADIGTWKGSGHAFSPSVDFAITMTIRAGQVGQVVGEIDRPTLGCKQDLILDKATTQSITLTEQGGFCSVSAGQVAGNGYKILASLSGSSLDWKEFPGDPSAGNASATSTLTMG